MAQAVINVRMVEDLKAQFSKFCEKAGLTMSTAISMFARTTVREQELPFTVTTKKKRNFLKRKQEKDPFYNEENQKRLRELIEEAKKGHVVYHDLDELEQYL